MSRDVRIAPVRNRQDLHQFTQLPWQLYSDDPAWVPPLLFDLKKLLSPKKHPFHKHADVQYFLARLNGQVAGRIAAIVNHRHIQFHNESVGFFGFFESIDDQDVAQALLAAAEQWVGQRGVRSVRGPMSFSTNEECGLLVNGFNTAPMVMMSHHRPYYARLIRTAGYAKAKDLLAYLIDLREDATIPERLVHGVQRLQRKQAITIRSIDVRRFEEEVRLLHGIYHRAWEHNWGFVPMTEAEVDLLAHTLRLVADPKLCLIAELDNRPVGFALALPDYNQVLRRMNGRLFPLGALKLLWYKRRIDALRVLLLGTNPDVRVRGLDAMLYLKLWQHVLAYGYRLVECSWILEDNWSMQRGLERMGARIYKTYRVFEKTL